MKPLAIIPARGGSKRFPRKNIALLNGKPLLAWAVESAKKSGVFDCVCVSSEDPEILRVAEEAGADLALMRPPELATDTAQTKHVCLHLLEQFAAEGKRYDVFSLLMPTSPFRTAEDIRQAYEIFEREKCDAVMSFVQCEYPPQQSYRIRNGRAEPFFDAESAHIRSQDLETLYRHDGAITFMKSDVFLERKEWSDTGVVPFLIPHEHAVDIDSPRELLWAEFLLTHR